MAWTVEQKQAIHAKEGRYLVSAGAGSGKTAVLTERIKELVFPSDESTQDCQLENLLVLTFTKNAAAEMKERIRKRLLKLGKEDLSSKAEQSDITDFDAFALSLVKRFYYLIDVPSSPDIVDPSLYSAIRENIIDEVLERHYEESDDDLKKWLEHYEKKDDANLYLAITILLDASEKSIDQKAFYEDLLDKAIKPVNIKNDVYLNFHEKLEKLSRLQLKIDSDEVREKLTPCFDYFKGVHDYESLKTIISERGFESPRASFSKGTDEKDKKVFAYIRDEIKKLQASLLESFSIDTNNSLSSYKIFLINLAKECEEKLQEWKKERGVYTFSDIASFARQIVSHPKAHDILQKQYRYVMIDEYQDTSDLQENLIKELGSENVFMVGDLKQSIYRFRNANPSLFKEKLETYQNHEKGTIISLNHNFRSKEEVLNDINRLFSSLMHETLGGVEYQYGHQLQYGNLTLKGEKDPKNGFSVLRYSLDEYQDQEDQKTKIESSEVEARIIAEDIIKKVQTKYLISTKDKNEKHCYREAKYGDFAILLDRRNDFSTYRRVFEEYGIPLAISDRPDISASETLLAFVAILRYLVKGDEALLHTYLSLARSFLYRYDDTRIYQEVTDGSYKQADFILLLREKRGTIQLLSISEVVEWILENFPWQEAFTHLGHVKDNMTILLNFLESAKAADRYYWKLEDYYERYANNVFSDSKIEGTATQPSGDLVRLMTIHASKGLEFPLVYLASLSKKRNKSNENKRMFYNKKTGLVIPSPDCYDRRPFEEYLNKEEEEREAISERMRLFYVAVTRASQHLFFVYDKGKKEYDALGDNLLLIEDLEKEKNSFTVREPRDFKEYLLMANIESPTFAEVKDVKIQENVEKPASSKSLEASPLSFHHLNVKPEFYKEEGISKRLGSEINYGALRYGNKLHRYMELLDFKSKDLTFIKENNIREKIEEILNLPPFQDLKEAEIYPEYRYFDEERGQEASIDLLLLYPHEAVVIDYKAFDIDDPSYDKQLNSYGEYVRRTFQKPTTLYLLSLGQKRYRKVELKGDGE